VNGALRIANRWKRKCGAKLSQSTAPCRVPHIRNIPVKEAVQRGKVVCNRDERVVSPRALTREQVKIHKPPCGAHAQHVKTQQRGNRPENPEGAKSVASALPDLALMNLCGHGERIAL
jgi:hypothetical protein